MANGFLYRWPLSLLRSLSPSLRHVSAEQSRTAFPGLFARGVLLVVAVGVVWLRLWLRYDSLLVSPSLLCERKNRRPDPLRGVQSYEVPHVARFESRVAGRN